MLNKKWSQLNHPYLIIKQFSKYALLLPVSLTQNILRDESFNISLAIFTIAFLTTIIYYMNIYFSLSMSSLQYKCGFFRHNYYDIPLSKIIFIRVKKSAFTQLFSCMKIKIETFAGNYKKADINLLLNPHKCKQLIQSIVGHSYTIFKYFPSSKKMLLASLLYSNPTTGLLIIIPILNNAERILGKEIKNITNIKLQLLSIGLHPTVTTITYLSLASWIIATCIIFFKNCKFSACKTNFGLTIQYGLLSITKDIIKKENINAIIIKQTLSMYFLKLYSTYLSAIGNNKEKADRRLLIPLTTYSHTQYLILNLTNTSHVNLNTKKVASPRSTIKNYLLLPALVGTILIIFVCKTPMILFPLFTVLILLDIWWILFRYIAFRESGLSYTEHNIIITNFKRLSLRNIIIPCNKITHIKTSRSLFQKVKGMCNVRIGLTSENNNSYKIIHLRNTDVENFVQCVETSITHPQKI